MSVCCGWCAKQLSSGKKHHCKKSDIRGHIKYGTKATENPFGWMKVWLQAYDAENKGTHGKEIYEWIQSQPMGC